MSGASGAAASAPPPRHPTTTLKTDETARGVGGAAAAASPPRHPAMPPKANETATGVSEAAAAATAPRQPAATVMAAQRAVGSAAQRTGERGFAVYCGVLASVGESQSAIAADVAAMALEMTEMTHANLKAAGDGFTAFLKARSLVDAVEAQLGFARRSLDAMVGGSTRIGKLGLRLAGDAAKPILHRFTR